MKFFAILLLSLGSYWNNLQAMPIKNPMPQNFAINLHNTTMHLQNQTVGFYDNLTGVQKTTLYAFLSYALWELAVQTFTPEANIRIDLGLFYPVLTVLTGWSLIDFLRK